MVWFAVSTATVSGVLPTATLGGNLEWPPMAAGVTLTTDTVASWKLAV
jgi:hypothetical protein